MKKYIFIGLALTWMCSCKTINGTLVTIDKSHAADEIIYDLAESYEIPDIGTVYDYRHKATVVTNSDYVDYEIKAGDTWYSVCRSEFNRLKPGDRITNHKLNKIKN